MSHHFTPMKGIDLVLVFINLLIKKTILQKRWNMQVDKILNGNQKQISF